jgi:hypothetical protein
VAADLVVDASGRNSRLPRWLAATGRPAAAEVEVDADISYASRFYEMPPSVRSCHELTAAEVHQRKTRMLGAFITEPRARCRLRGPWSEHPV